MIFHRKCKSCNGEYEYEGYANLIVFCPNCYKFDYLECEYGYGPVVPCRIYLGNEEIAMVTYHNGGETKYQYDSTKFCLHKDLKNDYLEALYEARDITAQLLKV
ncbi:MAG: hypothetical protein K0S41_3823 [Anaerocolumna sp.]|jgi:hypothetical protein|nr:hypothetical protein [Anaerocolumna sp.]